MHQCFGSLSLKPNPVLPAEHAGHLATQYFRVIFRTLICGVSASTEHELSCLQCILGAWHPSHLNCCLVI